MAERNKPGKPTVSTRKLKPRAAAPDRLLHDLRSLIRQTREGVAQAVNSALVLLYWQIGQRIRTEILKEKRADYGEQIVPTLSAQLVPDFGRGPIFVYLGPFLRCVSAPRGLA
jgi:hypothetical protein